MSVTYRPHVWNEPSGICALCGEFREWVQSPDHPTAQWWCWDATYDFDGDPP